MLANQFEYDESSDAFEIPFVFEGRMEQIKFKNTAATPESVEPASPRQSAATEEMLPDEQSRRPAPRAAG